MPLSLINTGGGAYNTPKTSGFGLNANTLYGIAQKAPIVGGIVSNIASVGKAVGIHIDPKSPATHIKERTAQGEILKSSAISGNNLAWEKLWTSSGRELPVRRVDTVPRVEDDKATKQNEFFGWARVGDVLTAQLRDVENARGSLPQPSGLSTSQVVGMTVDSVVSGGPQTTESGGTFGGLGFGIGNSPANHDGAQSNAPPSSTDYVVVGGLILAMLLILRKRG